MTPGELLNPFEILALLDKDAKIVDVGLDGLILEVEGLGTVVLWACLNCSGEDAHLNFAFGEGDDGAGST